MNLFRKSKAFDDAMHHFEVEQDVKLIDVNTGEPVTRMDAFGRGMRMMPILGSIANESMKAAATTPGMSHIHTGWVQGIPENESIVRVTLLVCALSEDAARDYVALVVKRAVNESGGTMRE